MTPEWQGIFFNKLGEFGSKLRFFSYNDHPGRSTVWTEKKLDIQQFILPIITRLLSPEKKIMFYSVSAVHLIKLRNVPAETYHSRKDWDDMPHWLAVALHLWVEELVALAICKSEIRNQPSIAQWNKLIFTYIYCKSTKRIYINHHLSSQKLKWWHHHISHAENNTSRIGWKLTPESSGIFWDLLLIYCIPSNGLNHIIFSIQMAGG